MFSDRVLGSSIAKDLRNRITAPLLRIGSDVFTRHDLAALDCFAFLAAANLSAILTEHLKVKNTRDLYHRISPTALALPRLGAVSIAVLGAAFEKVGVGTLDEWVTAHEAHMTTFHQIKHRDAIAQAAAKKDDKARAHARRASAHRLRVDRFTERAGASL